MANPTFNVGLKPVKYIDDRPFDGAFKRYYIPATYATNVFIGDAVVVTGTSNAAAVNTCSSKYKIGSLMEVNRVTVGDVNPITGVVIGFDPTPANVVATTVGAQGKYGLASTERVAHVVDSSDVLFHIRDDGAAALTAASVGLNAVLIEGTGSTVTGVSGLKLDTNFDVPAADASNQLMILGVADIPYNDVGVNCVWEVKLQQVTKDPAVIGT